MRAGAVRMVLTSVIFREEDFPASAAGFGAAGWPPIRSGSAPRPVRLVMRNRSRRSMVDVPRGGGKESATMIADGRVGVKHLAGVAEARLAPPGGRTVSCCGPLARGTRGPR